MNTMERLFVIVCALSAGATVRSEKIQRSVDNFDYYNQNYINAEDVYRGLNGEEPVKISLNRVNAPIKIKSRFQSEKLAELEIYKLLSNTTGPIDIVKLNTLGDRLISRANVTEEARRVVRQVKKQRPGFFWTLFRVTFETVSDAVSTIQEISNVLGKAISPDTTTRAPQPTLPSNGTLGVNATTTEAPFRLTPQGIASTIRRNLKGLIRLFNIEWKDAIDQSQVNIREFKQALGKSAAPFLADNPNAF